MTVVTDRNAIVGRLNALYGSGMTWREIGAVYGVSGAMAFRVATQDYEPKDPQIRKRLGLPVPVTTWKGEGGRFVKRDRPG